MTEATGCLHVTPISEQRAQQTGVSVVGCLLQTVTATLPLSAGNDNRTEHSTTKKKEKKPKLKFSLCFRNVSTSTSTISVGLSNNALGYDYLYIREEVGGSL